MFGLYFRGIVITAMTETTPIMNVKILTVLHEGLLNIPYNPIKITIMALNPKSTDKVPANASFFQKNCPTRQTNKGKNQITIKISALSIVCERITLLVISKSNNPIGTIRTISCQNVSAGFNDLFFILLTDIFYFEYIRY